MVSWTRVIVTLYVYCLSGWLNPLEKNRSVGVSQTVFNGTLPFLALWGLVSWEEVCWQQGFAFPRSDCWMLLLHTKLYSDPAEMVKSEKKRVCPLKLILRRQESNKSKNFVYATGGWNSSLVRMCELEGTFSNGIEVSLVQSCVCEPFLDVKCI